MTKAKNTKRALLASVLSMMLCVAMLIGTTFAWFTDSVTSGKNQIVAGNLDVELYARKVVDGKPETEYKPVTETTDLFENGALWEPGHVEVINLKIVNEGTLALKYVLGVSIAAEKTSVSIAQNKDGNNTLKLSDHIKFAIIDGDDPIADRAAAIAKAVAADRNYKLSNLPVKDGDVLYPEDKVAEGTPSSEKTVTLIVYMPEDVGNEANWDKNAKIDGKPAEAPTIDLGIKLHADQTPMEADSFDDQYDANIETDNNNIWFNVTIGNGEGEGGWEDGNKDLEDGGNITVPGGPGISMG